MAFADYLNRPVTRRGLLKDAGVVAAAVAIAGMPGSNKETVNFVSINENLKLLKEKLAKVQQEQTDEEEKKETEELVESVEKLQSLITEINTTTKHNYPELVQEIEKKCAELEISLADNVVNFQSMWNSKQKKDFLTSINNSLLVIINDLVERVKVQGREA